MTNSEVGPACEIASSLHCIICESCVALHGALSVWGGAAALASFFFIQCESFISYLAKLKIQNSVFREEGCEGISLRY